MIYVCVCVHWNNIRIEKNSFLLMSRLDKFLGKKYETKTLDTFGKENSQPLKYLKENCMLEEVSTCCIIN